MRPRLWFPVVSLLAASAWCVIVFFVGPISIAQVNLVWNLALAWVPLLLALAMYAAFRCGRTTAELVVIGGAWLLFLPNAPYVLTDVVVYLGDQRVFFGALVLGSFAFTALALGFASLLLVQIVVTRVAGAAAGWSVAVTALFLSSVGMYLGRVDRFNSWDVVRRPHLVAWTLRQRLDDPLGNHELLLFVTATGVFLTLAYVVVYGVAQLASPGGRHREAPVLLSKRSWQSRSSTSNRS
jgi:uncharacterized membrane protein